MAIRASRSRSKKKTKKAKPLPPAPKVVDPASGRELPPVLTYAQFCELWPMGLSTLRRKVGEGWVRVQRTSHSLAHITRAEFIRMRQATQEQAGEPVVETTQPKKKQSRRRS